MEQLKKSSGLKNKKKQKKQTVKQVQAREEKKKNGKRPVWFFEPVVRSSYNKVLLTVLGTCM